MTVGLPDAAVRESHIAKAFAVPKEIRLRNTPRREIARLKNIERTWARQRDPNQFRII